jgi:hypothetical protein
MLMSWVESIPTTEGEEIKLQPGESNFPARHSQGSFSLQPLPPPSEMQDCLFGRLNSNHLVGQMKSFLMAAVFLHVMPCSLVEVYQCFGGASNLWCVRACVSKGPDTNMVGDQTPAE